MRIGQQPAFVLHHRDYRETSLLLELFSRDHGRVGLIAKGARRPKSAQRAILSPFQPLLASWSGKGDLGVLTGAEADGLAVALTGEALFCGFYINELLLRLVHRHDPHEALYEAYCQCLRALEQGNVSDASLRIFEKHLLRELGYGLVLDHAVATNQPLDPQTMYDYVPELGPRAVEENPDTASYLGVRIHGRSLLALAEEELADPQILRELKVLMRVVLARYLGDKPLHSRRLFRTVAVAVRHGAE